MNRLLTAGAAIAGFIACNAAMAQPVTNTPALLGEPGAYNPAPSATPGSGAGPTAPVDLGGAGHFVILSKSGITDVRPSDVVGNVGTSPITGAADHLSCAEVTGKVYSVDAAGPNPCSIEAPSTLTTAIGDMQTAYTDAAGRHPTTTELGGGNIGGLTLAPGIYKWTTNVTIPTDVTLKGDSHAIWIFQISKSLTLSNGKAVKLGGNAQPQNIFWQVAGQVTLGTTSKFEGIILSKTLIAMQTGASIDGRLLAQTAVTLQMNGVTTP
jgi:Ice-binding-like